MKGEKGERRKKELLKIAYRMFIEKGYDNTSIDEIITETGKKRDFYTNPRSTEDRCRYNVNASAAGRKRYCRYSGTKREYRYARKNKPPYS